MTVTMTSGARRHAAGEPWATIGLSVLGVLGWGVTLIAGSIALFLLAQPCPVDVPCQEHVDPLVVVAFMLGAPFVAGLAGIVVGVVRVVRRRRGWPWVLAGVGTGTVACIVGAVLAFVGIA